MYKEKFFKISTGIILILLIIFLLEQVPTFSYKLKSLLSIIIIPFFLSIFLYYLLRPSVNFFHKYIKNRSLSIFITFTILVIIIVFIMFFSGNIIFDQSKKIIQLFSSNYEENINKILEKLNESKHTISFFSQFELEKTLLSIGKYLFDFIKNYNYIKIFSSLSNIATMTILTPFLLFYFLKDENIIYNNMMSIISENKRKKFEPILSEIDKSLSTYIISQLIIAICLGIFTFIGYLLIGIPNALILALINMVLSLIPIIGTIFGVLPAIFIALTLGIPMIVKVLIVLLIAQFLEGNIARPLIQGKTLEIHPIVVILIVIIAIFLFGALGALFVVPFYIIVKIFIKNYRNIKDTK